MRNGDGDIRAMSEPLAERRVRSFLVVVPPPSLDFDPRFPEAVEDLTIQKLIAQFAIEALAVAILPRAARDEQGLRTDLAKPVPDDLGSDRRAVVLTVCLPECHGAALHRRTSR
jgi:hypothetical protein